MRPSTLRAITTVVLLCCAGLCSRTNSQTKPAKKETGATVSGKVTIKGKPAPGFVVGMRLSQPQQFASTFKATTDPEGNYRITDVPPGSYEVALVASAFVISDANNSRGQTVVITEAEHVEGIDFELVRGGVITGKVTDANGQPIVEERVTLLSIDERNQRGLNYPGSVSFQTDDRGIYRMFGIRPGRYKVSVGDAGDNFYGQFGRRGPAYQRTFHPDTTDPEKATVVEIEEGTEATKVDIALGQPQQGFSVTGRVVDEGGKPVANVSIGLSKIIVIDANNTSSSGGGTGARSDSQGEFHLEKLPPGKYSISIYPAAELNLLADPITFDILDQDVTGLLIKASMGVSVSGIVVLEGTNDARAVAALSRAYVAASVYHENPNAASGRPTTSRSGKAARLAPDGSFMIGGLTAGTANFSVNASNNGRGLTVSRIERDGVVQPNGVQIQNGEQVTGIRIIVTYSNGSIRGVVKVDNGPLPTGGRLIVQLIKPGDQPGNIRPVDADARGHFLIEGLAAGNYELRAIAYVPGSGRRPPIGKQIVTVTDGEATDVTVTIDLAAPPNP